MAKKAKDKNKEIVKEITKENENEVKSGVVHPDYIKSDDNINFLFEKISNNYSVVCDLAKKNEDNQDLLEILKPVFNENVKKAKNHIKTIKNKTNNLEQN